MVSPIIAFILAQFFGLLQILREILNSFSSSAGCWADSPETEADERQIRVNGIDAKMLVDF